MISHDLQPFSVVEDIGFRSIAQHFIDIGARYGNLSIDDILYDRTTLAGNHLSEEYNKCKSDLSAAIKQNKFLAVTTDHWTDDMIKNAYQAFTAHFITAKFKLVEKCLGLYEFPEAKKAIAVKNKTTTVLASFTGENSTHEIVFVTDNGSNMRAAYKNDVRISCTGHNINLVVENSLKCEASSECVQMLKIAREMVGYFKHSGHNKDLEHTLKQDVSTRWNSQFFMLQSLLSNYDDVMQILEQEKQFDKLEHLSSVSKTDLTSTINFLHDFHTATVQLSKSQEPTLFLVWPVLDRLMSACETKPSDSEMICGLKSSFKQSLTEKYVIHPMHRMAAVLCPAFKHLTFATTQEKEATYKDIRDQLESFVAGETQNESGRSSDSDSSSSAGYSSLSTPLIDYVNF
jgi:hypothetical protein